MQTKTIYVGTQPEPEDRLKLEISQADFDALPNRGTRGTGTVTDIPTGKVYKVRRASCGLPNCLCALALVK